MGGGWDAEADEKWQQQGDAWPETGKGVSWASASCRHDNLTTDVVQAQVSSALPRVLTPSRPCGPLGGTLKMAPCREGCECTGQECGRAYCW